LTADVSQLYALRLKLTNPGEHDILPDVISKEPLAPVVRHKDDDWLMLVKWTFFAMVNAEELGINSQNVNEALESKKPTSCALWAPRATTGRSLD
jgi:general L-amino acid transport system substrate-binding protein